MTLVPYDKKELHHYKRSDNLKILEEFAKSGLDCARIEGWTQKNATTCVESLRNSIRHYHMNGITVSERKGKVYLIREN